MIRRAVLRSATAAVVLSITACELEAPVASRRVQPPEPLMASASDDVPPPTPLGTFGGVDAVGFDINDRGEVAGVRNLTTFPGEPPEEAIFWSDKTGHVALPTLGGTRTRAVELNNERIVVGRSQKAGEPVCRFHPTLWKVSNKAKRVQTLEVGSFPHGELSDVNERGVAVGWYSNAPSSCSPPVVTASAFLWSEADGFTFLPALAAGLDTRANAVNEARDAAGGSGSHAVLWWADGTVTDIGTLADPARTGGSAVASAINARREVVGFGRECASPACPSRAFYWSEADGLVIIGPFSARDHFVFDIDNDGRVSGFYDIAPSSPGALPVRNAFVWTKEGGKVDLPGIGGTFASSGDINRKGQMSGRASDPSGVVQAVIWDLGKAKKEKP